MPLRRRDRPACGTPTHRKEAEALALAPHTHHLQLVADGDVSDHRPLLELGEGDYDVDIPDLDSYSFGEGCGSLR